MKNTKRSFRPAWLEEVEGVRAKSCLLSLRFYCESTDCEAREFEVEIKDLDTSLIETIRKKGVRCPICGNRNLRLSGAVTQHENSKAKREKARDSVAWEMAERGHGSGGFVTVCLGDTDNTRRDLDEFIVWHREHRKGDAHEEHEGTQGAAAHARQPEVGDDVA